MSARRDGGTRLAGRLLLLAAPWLVSCTHPVAAPPEPPAVPESEPPLAEAVSADGRYRLRLDAIFRSGGPGEPQSPVVHAMMRMRGLAHDEILASGGPLRRVVTADGVEHPPIPPGTRWNHEWWVHREEGGIGGNFDVGLEEDRLALLALEVPVVRVLSWHTLAARGIAEGATAALEASPFRLAIETGPVLCRVSVSGGEPGVLDRPWAVEAVEVRDARGAPLERRDGPWTRQGVAGDFTAPWPERGVPGPIAYPVEVRIRVPKEQAVERVEFEFRDVPLPPKQGGVLAAGGFEGYEEWTAWSEPVNGASCRVSLPGKATLWQGFVVGFRLRFDPDSLPAGITHFDGRALEDRVRLRFRNSATGATVELEDDDGTLVRDCPPDEGELPEASGDIALREGVEREWGLQFDLASALEGLSPGAWEVRAVLETAPDPVYPADWSGTLVSEAHTIELEAAPPRRLRILVPTALRLRPGAVPGSAEVLYGPREAEIVEVESTPGFDLGSSVEQDTHGGSSGYGPFVPDIDPLVDSMERLREGPLDTTYAIEVFECEPVGSRFPWPEPGRGSYRTLWKRSFRVTATAEEVRALSGSVPPLPALKPEAEAQPGPEPGGSLRVEFRCEGGPVTPRDVELWRYEDGVRSSWSKDAVDGIARFDGVEEGAHTLEVKPGPAYERVPRRIVEIHEGRITEVVVDLERRTPLGDAMRGVRGTVTFHPAWGRFETSVRIEGADPGNADVEEETDPFPAAPGAPTGFAFGRLPAGRYRVCVFPQWHEEIEVPEGGGAFDFAIPEPGEIRIRVVTEETGVPIRSARLSWIRNMPGDHVQTCDSVAPHPRTGEFLLRVPPGDMHFSVYGPGKRGSAWRPDGSESLVIESGARIERTVRVRRLVPEPIPRRE